MSSTFVSFNRATWLALATALLALPGVAHGQTAEAPAKPATEAVVTLPAFETSAQGDTSYVGKSALSSTRIAVPLDELPQSVVVLNNSFLKAVNPLNLSDVLNYVGGAQNGNLGFTPGRVNIRGFTGDGDYVDGFAPPSSILMDSAIFDRFEVIKGPSTIFLAADGSPGGVVNKISKSPTTARANSVSVQVGRFNANNASLDSTGALTQDGDLSYRLVMAQQYSDGVQDTTHLYRFTIMPQLTYRFSDDAKLEVKALLVNADFPSYTSIPVDPRTLKQFDIPEDRAQAINSPFQWVFDDKVERVWATFTDRLNDHVVLRLAGMNATDRLARDVLLANTWNEGARAWVVPGYNGTQTFPFAVVSDDSKTTYRDLQADVNINFNIGRVANNLLIGSELNYGGLGRTSHPGTSTPWNPYGTTGPTFSINKGAVSAQTHAINTLARAFVLDTVKFFDDRLIFSLGASRARTTVSVQNKLTGAYTTPEYVLYKNLKQYGAVFKVRPGVSLFYGYNENFAVNGTGIIGGVSGPLPPKLGKQSEVGVKTTFLEDRLTANVSYFDVQQENNTLPSVPFDPLNPNVLIPGVISRGFDGDVSYQVNKNLYLMGSFSWYHAKSVLGPFAATFVQPYYGRIVTGSIPVNNTAERAARLLGMYRFTDGPLKGLDVGLGFDYQSRKAVTDSANQVMFSYLPERTIFNANAGYTLNKRVRLQLNIDNLLDEDYLYAARNGNQIVTGDPINIKLGATYTF